MEAGEKGAGFEEATLRVPYTWRGQEPRKAHGLKKLEKVRSKFSPRYRPTDVLISVQ